jgi:hypothetical protein
MMNRSDTISTESAGFAGRVPEPQICGRAGSASQGCAVQFGVESVAGPLKPGFYAFAAPEVIGACEWLCRHWTANGQVERVSLDELQRATGLSRDWAGELLVVCDAAAALCEAWQR